MYFKYGHLNQDVAAKSFITIKSSAVGDEGSSLTALTVWLNYIIAKNGGNNSDEYKVCGRSYYCMTWAWMMVYFTVWGTLYYIALGQLNLATIDFYMMIILTLWLVYLCFLIEKSTNCLPANTSYRVWYMTLVLSLVGEIIFI